MAQHDDDSITVPSPEKQKPSLRKTHPQGDWSRDPRGDSRYAFKVFPPVQIARLTIPLAADFRIVIADSDLGSGGQRLLGAILRHTDYPTRVCARRRRYLLKEARIVERWAAMLVAQFEEAGILSRLRYDAKHPDLYPPQEWELKGTDEWELGCWLLRWEPTTSGADLAERLRQLRRPTKDGGSHVQGDDLEIIRGVISRSSGGRSGDHPGGDLEIIPSFARKEDLDQDRLLSPDPPSPSSALSDHRGTLGESTTATPGGEASPAARKVSSLNETAPPGNERAVREGECKDRTAVSTAPASAADARARCGPQSGPEGAQAPQTPSTEEPVSRKDDLERVRAAWGAANGLPAHRLSIGEGTRIHARLDEGPVEDVLAVVAQASRSPYNKPGSGRNGLLCLLKRETFDRLLSDARAAAAPAAAADWVPPTRAEFDAAHPDPATRIGIPPELAAVVAEVTAGAPESRAAEYAEARERAAHAAFAEGRGAAETERLKREAHEKLRAAGLLELDATEEP